MRTKWYGIVKAKTGFLLGGTVTHISTNFNNRKSAKTWIKTVIETNKEAGRDPDNGYVASASK